MHTSIISLDFYFPGS